MVQRLQVKEVIYDEEHRQLTLVLPDGRKVDTDLRYETGMTRTMVRGQILQENPIG